MVRKNALGKGLGALIPEFVEEKVETDAENSHEFRDLSTKSGENVDNSVDKVVEISLSKVEPRAGQPRMIFDENALHELSESIKQHGVLQPILVCRKDDHYEIVAGERRWRAAKQAGLMKIPAIIRNYSDQDLTEVSLIENIQRENLNPIEEAQAYKQLQDDFRLKQDELAKRVSKSRTAIANCLRLLKLSEAVQAMVMDGTLSEGHARTLLGINDKKKQLEAARLVVEKHLNVRETERLVKRMSQPEPVKSPQDEWRSKDQTAYDELELKLRKELGTKVSIRRTEADKGQIIIDYYSVEDLERLSEKLK